MIKAAAIIGYDGKVYSLPKPKRHHHIIHWMARDLKHPIPIIGAQGFITEDDRYVDRITAKGIAKNAGQIISKRTHKELFSEDLW